MEHIISFSWPMQVVGTLLLLAAGGSLAAFLLLTRGLAASAICLASLACFWMMRDTAPASMYNFIIWYGINWLVCYAVVGRSGISVLKRKGKIGWFSAVDTD